MVTICTTSLTFNNSTFCPHSVFMCFVWISEQTAIISLYSINWLVFITETEFVYCAVRTGYLNIIRVNLCLRKLMVYKMTGAHLQPPHFQPSGVCSPLLEESQLQSVRLPELQACVTAWTTPALVTAYMKAVSLLPAQTTQHTDNKFETIRCKGGTPHRRWRSNSYLPQFRRPQNAGGAFLWKRLTNTQYNRTK